MALGAEYLPLRDTSLWLEAQLWGLDPRLLRISNWSVYVASILLLRGALQRVLVGFWRAELAIWVFALHPAHVESVAWLAGRKDVLALFFMSAALWVHARGARGSVVWVPVLCALAQLSKGVAVVALVLLVAFDVLRRRRAPWALYASVGLLSLGIFMVHAHVGALLGMSGAPAGGSRWTAAMTMGPVWLRYLGLVVWPPALSIVQERRVAVRRNTERGGPARYQQPSEAPSASRAQRRRRGSAARRARALARDPKILSNLAEVVARPGRAEEARLLAAELAQVSESVRLPAGAAPSTTGAARSE